MNRVIADQILALANRIIRGYLALQQAAREAGVPPEILAEMAQRNLQVYSLLRQMRNAFQRSDWENVVYLGRAILTHYQHTHTWMREHIGAAAERVAAIPQNLWSDFRRILPSPRFTIGLGIALMIAGGIGLWAVFRVKKTGKKLAIATGESAGLDLSEYAEDAAE